MSDKRFLQQGFNKVLSHAIEECGEFLAAAGKTQRWGAMSVNPLLRPADQETNLVWLRREMADVHEALIRLETAIRVEFDGDAVSENAP
jgi:hypothetical protein